MRVFSQIILTTWRRLWNDAGETGQPLATHPSPLTSSAHAKREPRWQAQPKPRPLRFTGKGHTAIAPIQRSQCSNAEDNRGFPFGQMNSHSVNRTGLFIASFTCDIKDLRCAAVA